MLNAQFLSEAKATGFQHSSYQVASLNSRNVFMENLIIFLQSF